MADRTFSLWSFLLAIALIGACLGAGVRLGIVLGVYGTLLVCVYFVARRMGRTTAATCLVVVLFLAVVPWFGVGRGVLIAIGTEQRLPTIPTPASARDILRGIYDISALPVEVPAFFFGGSFAHFAYFANSHTVRPFVVFVFWLGIALTVGAAGLVRIVQARFERHRRAAAAITRSHSETQRTANPNDMEQPS